MGILGYYDLCGNVSVSGIKECGFIWLRIGRITGSKDSLATSPGIGRKMINKILWFLILGLMVLQSGCALENYPQGSGDYSSLKYSQADTRSGAHSEPEPG
jgi:hypothetical protein